MDKEKVREIEEKRHKLVLILGDLERRAADTRLKIEDLTRAIMVEIRHRGRSKN